MVYGYYLGVLSVMWVFIANYNSHAITVLKMNLYHIILNVKRRIGLSRIVLITLDP